MIHIDKATDCCGCTACESICPKDAITMQPDALGFLYPKIDLNRCIDCGLCEKVCAFNDNYDKKQNLENPLAYAVRHKNIEEVETSRSGAAFIAFSDWVLEQGGVVYGAGYTDHFRVIHKRATTTGERDEFKGSKYVQSDLNNVFRQIKKDLKDGLVVLFSGTPCQTSGLRSYMDKRLMEKLFIIDIVCHGVPSPSVWRDYLAYQEKKHHCIFDEISFRNKRILGWADHKESFAYKGKTIISSIYTRLFYKHIMFRHSCEVCHFTNLKRPSDITIADFWGWEKTDAHMNADNKGISLVFINSNKGLEWFGKVRKNVEAISAKLEDCLQPNLQHPSIIDPQRNQFEIDYARNGLVYVMRKYGFIGWRYTLAIIRKKSRTAIRLLFKK